MDEIFAEIIKAPEGTRVLVWDGPRLVYDLPIVENEKKRTGEAVGTVSPPLLRRFKSKLIPRS